MFAIDHKNRYTKLSMASSNIQLSHSHFGILHYWDLSGSEADQGVLEIEKTVDPAGLLSS